MGLQGGRKTLAHYRLVFRSGPCKLMHEKVAKLLTPLAGRGVCGGGGLSVSGTLGPATLRWQTRMLASTSRACCLPRDLLAPEIGSGLCCVVVVGGGVRSTDNGGGGG